MARPGLAAARKALEKLEADLLAKESRRIDPNRTDDADVGGDDDMQPLTEMSQAIASNRNRADMVRLQRVRAALRRLDTHPDDFGVCTDCGDDIPEARMKAMPWVELCVACQSDRDKRGPATRSKLTDFR